MVRATVRAMVAAIGLAHNLCKHAAAYFKRSEACYQRHTNPPGRKINNRRLPSSLP